MKATELLHSLGQSLWLGIVPELENREEPKLAHDSSTNHLIRRSRIVEDA